MSTKDGRIHWMRQSVSAVRDEAGKVRYMIVIAEDIEERKRALEELRESEAKFRAMFESAAIGMGLGEINGNILAANAALCKMSGYTEEELKQRNDSQNSYPEDAQVGMDLFAEMMAGKRDYYSVEKTVRPQKRRGVLGAPDPFTGARRRRSDHPILSPWSKISTSGNENPKSYANPRRASARCSITPPSAWR